MDVPATEPAPWSIHGVAHRAVLAGDIDAACMNELDTVLAGLEAGDITVDVSAVSFMDSSALRVLIQHHRDRAEAGATLSLLSPSPPVRRLFELAGLESYFGIAVRHGDQPAVTSAGSTPPGADAGNRGPR